jgi:hypothetical protein
MTLTDTKADWQRREQVLNDKVSELNFIIGALSAYAKGKGLLQEELTKVEAQAVTIYRKKYSRMAEKSIFNPNEW